jgi:Fe-S-cluster containining protein
MICSQCGECCKYITLGRISQYREDQKEYLRTHGVLEDQGFFIIPFKCPHLELKVKSVDDTIWVHICDIQDTKPKICKQFDGRKFKNRTLYWVPKCCKMAVKDA